jgi:hypothetical protein
MEFTRITPIACAVCLLVSSVARAQTSPEASRDEPAPGNSLLGTRAEDMPRSHAPSRDFDALDSSRHGYLTPEDVKGDVWLSSNFERCNSSHDGHMRREEFDNCHE